MCGVRGGLTEWGSRLKTTQKTCSFRTPQNKLLYDAPKNLVFVWHFGPSVGFSEILDWSSTWCIRRIFCITTGVSSHVSDVLVQGVYPPMFAHQTTLLKLGLGNESFSAFRHLGGDEPTNLCSEEEKCARKRRDGHIPYESLNIKPRRTRRILCPYPSAVLYFFGVGGGCALRRPVKASEGSIWSQVGDY